MLGAAPVRILTSRRARQRTASTRSALSKIFYHQAEAFPGGHRARRAYLILRSFSSGDSRRTFVCASSYHARAGLKSGDQDDDAANTRTAIRLNSDDNGRMPSSLYRQRRHLIADPVVLLDARSATGCAVRTLTDEITYNHVPPLPSQARRSGRYSAG